MEKNRRFALLNFYYPLSTINLDRYVIISLTFHLLLLAVVAVSLPGGDRAPSFYQVSLVPEPDNIEPLIEEKSEIAEKPPLAMPQKPVIVRRRPRIVDDVKPETLLGKGRGTPSGQEETRDQRRQSSVAGSESRQSEQMAGMPLPEVSGQQEETGLYREGEATMIPRSSLFDRKTIEQLAEKSVPTAQGLTFDTSEFEHRGYMSMLKDKIESAWKYPKEAAQQGISGELYIHFSIERNGKLGEIELLRTSGYRELDEAAMRALRDAQPFWPLPDDWEGESLDIKGHFIYVYGATYVM